MIDFELMPNPNSGEFRIKLDGIFNYSIYSLQGSLLQAENDVNATTSISHNLKSGTYVLLIDQDGAKAARKMTVF